MPPRPPSFGWEGKAPSDFPLKRSFVTFDRGGQTGPPRSNDFFFGAADDLQNDPRTHLGENVSLKLPGRQIIFQISFPSPLTAPSFSLALSKCTLLLLHLLFLADVPSNVNSPPPQYAPPKRLRKKNFRVTLGSKLTRQLQQSTPKH